MIINKNLKLITMGCFASLILFSCESHEQKAVEAFDLVKEEKMLAKDSSLNTKKTMEEPKKIELVKKDQNPDEWMRFRVETEKKILSNDNKIKVIKNIPNANVKLLRKLASLEKENNDLRRQMDEYQEEVKVKWENFKLKISHDANEIDIELKDMTVNNVKSKK